MSFRVNFEKMHNFNFRVAILQIICTISNYIGTLNKKITSYSSYSQLKTLKATIFITGFPKKARQGCHISEGTQQNWKKCIAAKYLKGKNKIPPIRCFRNLFTGHLPTVWRSHVRMVRKVKREIRKGQRWKDLATVWGQ